ncbi:F-box domain-containing protein [Pleurotus pulmonarius]
MYPTPRLPVELLNDIFTRANDTSTMLAVMQSSRAFRDIAERILYHDVVLQLVPHEISTFYQFCEHICRRRAYFVRRLTIDVVHHRCYDPPRLDHYNDIASLLKLTPKLASFRLVDPLFTKMPRLLDIEAPVLPLNLKKLCLSTSPLDIEEFAAFLSQRAGALEHLEISPWNDYNPTPLHFNLLKDALPSLRVLSARSLDLIFHNIEGARNLTHLKLAPSLGDDTDVLLARFFHYAKHLANVTTFSCSFFHAGVFRLAGMMPRLERLDINLLLNLDIDCLMDENPGMHQEVAEDARLGALRMLRVTSGAKAHSDRFVPWVFKRFPSLESLEVPCISEEHGGDVGQNVLYRFGNATGVPSIIRWKCRQNDEWFQHWDGGVDVLVESVCEEDYRERSRPHYY